MLIGKGLRRIPRRSGPLLVLLLLGLAIVAIIVLGYRSQSAALENQVLNTLQTVANLKADTIQRSMAGQWSRATIFGRAPLFRGFLGTPADQVSQAERDRTARFVRDATAASGLDDLLLLDTEAQVRFAVRPLGQDISVWRSAAIEAMASGQTLFVDLHRNPGSDHIELGFVAPVMEAPGQPISGAVAMALNADTLLGPQLTTWPSANVTGQVMLIQRLDREILVLGRAGSPGSTRIILRRAPLQAKPIADRVLQGDKAPLSGTDSRGVRVLAASAAVPRTRWTLLVTMDRGEALAEVTRLGIVSFLLVLAALLVATTVVFFVEQRRRLRQALDDIAHDRALRQVVAQQRLFIERAPAGIAMFDGQMRYLAASRRYLRDYRLPAGDPQELVGRSHYDVMPDIPEKWRIIHRRVLAGETLSVEDDLFERADGQTEWVRWEMTPWLQSDGSIGGAMLFAELTTERKRAERALRDSELLFRQVVEACPSAMVMSDQAGRIEMVNRQAERVFGYTRDELLGRPIDSLVPARFRMPHAAFRQDFFNNPQPRLMAGIRDVFAQRKDGNEVPVEIGLSLIRSGELRLTLATIVDVSERARQTAALRKSEERLRQAQKMEAIGNLTGGMAHDFNNLLGVIIGNLDLAQLMAPQVPDMAELLHDALEAALHGAELTARLLAFARRQPLHPELVAINTVVSGTVRLLRRIIGEDMPISVDLATDVWPVLVDTVQLEAALVNLANNARDATPAGGSLHIATANRVLDADAVASQPDAEPGEYVEISVSDTGTGMTPAVLAQIFEPFFTTKPPGRGTGLGLSMVFGFIRQSGGHIDVGSEPGVGTTFRLHLPRSRQRPGDTLPPDEAGLPRAAGETVLVVEDNAALRRTVIRQLSELGYGVLTASDGAEALDRLEREHIDVLFSDVVMPGPIDGFALAHQARERRPAMRIILTSGFPMGRLGDRPSLPPEAVLWLSKPYRKRDLAQALRDALQE